MSAKPDPKNPDHARRVKNFVRDYLRAQEACHSAFGRGDETRANDAIDRMKAMERSIKFLPEALT